MAGKAQGRRRNIAARRLAPQGWGEDQLKARAAKSIEAMRKYDAMPPEYRALVNAYGMKVRALMRDGMTVDEIKAELG